MKLLASAFHKLGSDEVTRGQKSPKQSSFMNLNKITKIFSEVSKIFQLSRFVI